MAEDHPEPPPELEELLWALCKANPKALPQQIESKLLKAILGDARLKAVALKHADALLSLMSARSLIGPTLPPPRKPRSRVGNAAPETKPRV
jgi:hypothetical protein